MRRLVTYAELLEAARGDVFARWMVDPSAPLTAWALDDGVAWVRRTPRGRTSLTVLADVDEAARAVPAVVAQAPEVDWITLPRGAVPPLAEVVDPDVGDDWEWMSTDAPPPPQPHEEAVVPLRDDDCDAVAVLLHAASPRHSAAPDELGVRWFGVREGAGRLRACAALQQVGPGVPHLASIATHPDERGRGLGAAVTAAATRAALRSGAPVVTLGMYSDNDVARRLYARLGFGCEHRWSSRCRRR